MKTKILFFLLPFLTIGANAQKFYTKKVNSAGDTVTSSGQYIKLGTPSLLNKSLVPAGTNNGSTGLANIPYYAANVCGLNYVTGSVMTQTRTVADGYNTNGTGFPATIAISGLPTTCVQILQAYLYYDASYTEAAAPNTTATVTNPIAGVATYSATTIGTGPQKCWGEKGTASYRADVTAAIAGNGNYSITLNGFANAAWEVDGCTLFIIYQSGPTTGTVGTLFLVDGASVENTYTDIAEQSDSISGFDVCNNTTVAQSFFLIGDQTDDPANYTTNTESANFFASVATFPNNQWNFNSLPVSVTTGQSSTTFYPYTNDDESFAPPPPYDCYNWVMCGMYYQNTGCVSCVPVLSNPNTASGTLTNVTCFNDNNGSASVTATGANPPFTYLWSTGATTTTINNLSAGSYTVGVEDAICNTTDVVFDITQPTALTATTTMTQATCGNSNGSATVTASGGTSAYIYDWSPSGGNGVTANNLSAGTYTATVTDAHNCVATSVITVTSTTGLTVDIGATSNVKCNGESDGTAQAEVTGGTLPYTYAWTATGGSGQTGTGFSAGTYTVTVHDNIGCDGTASVVITEPTLLSVTATPTDIMCNEAGQTGSITANVTGGTTPYGYEWLPSGGVAATAGGLSAGSYTIVVTDANNCIATATATITEPAAPLAVVITGSNNICAGSTTTLTANVTGGTAPYAYAWAGIGLIPSTTSTASVTPPATETYTVTITDANNCQVTGIFTVNLGSALTANITGGTYMCANSPTPVTLCATANGTGDTYAWSPGGETTQCISVSPSATTTYTVTVTDNCAQTANATATINVNPAPLVNFSLSGNEGCVPNCVQFYNTSTSTGPAGSYAWLFGDGDSSVVKSPNHCYTYPGVYSVELTVVSDSGCSSSLTKTDVVTVYAPPVAAFNYTPQPASIINPTIQFIDQSTGTYPIFSWLWTFGDNLDSISNSPNAVHTYQDTGTFCATLVIQDIHGCIDSVTNCLVMNPIFTLYIPSAFTPNGDGMDDFFQPVGSYIKTFSMYIFDRWGNQLYYTDNINNGWNGKAKGGSNVAQEDVYVYQIEVTDAQNKTHSYVGSVTLLK